MLGYIGKAARLVLLLVANPNLLLLIKDVRLIKTGGRLELEVRTHSRNTVASSPTGSSPPSLPRAHGKGVKSLLVRNTLPAIAAATGATLGYSASVAKPYGRPIAAAGPIRDLAKRPSASQVAVHKPKPVLPTRVVPLAPPAVPLPAAAPTAPPEPKPYQAPPSWPQRRRAAAPLSERGSLALLVVAIGGAAAARGLLLPAFPEAGAALPRLFEVRRRPALARGCTHSPRLPPPLTTEVVQRPTLPGAPSR